MSLANLCAVKLAIKFSLMTRTIWISRTQPSAEQSAALWQEAGYRTVTAPLLHIAHAPSLPLEPLPESVLVFTSKNGVRAFKAFGFAPRQKVITVGDATARAARDIGFTYVKSAQGTSQDVTDLILKTISKDVTIIHCAGRHVRGSICEDLQDAGYSARRDLYYHSEPITAWPDIDYSVLTHIAFYSPRAARSFCNLLSDITARPVSLDIHQLVFISISDAVDAEFEDLSLAMRRVAKRPNEAAMLDALRR